MCGQPMPAHANDTIRFDAHCVLRSGGRRTDCARNSTRRVRAEMQGRAAPPPAPGSGGSGGPSSPLHGTQGGSSGAMGGPSDKPPPYSPPPAPPPAPGQGLHLLPLRLTNSTSTEAGLPGIRSSCPHFIVPRKRQRNVHTSKVSKVRKLRHHRHACKALRAATTDTTSAPRPPRQSGPARGRASHPACSSHPPIPPPRPPPRHRHSTRPPAGTPATLTGNPLAPPTPGGAAHSFVYSVVASLERIC